MSNKITLGVRFHKGRMLQRSLGNNQKSPEHLPMVGLKEAHNRAGAVPSRDGNHLDVTEMFQRGLFDWFQPYRKGVANLRKIENVLIFAELKRIFFTWKYLQCNE